MAQIRLLVVDDDFVYQSLLCKLLNTHRDLRVVGRACDGEQAICLYRSLSPDVVLMDVNLPKLDGLASLRRIKKDDPRAKVLVLSVQDVADEGSRSALAGADAFLAKGASAHLVADTIRRISKREDSDVCST